MRACADLRDGTERLLRFWQDATPEEWEEAQHVAYEEAARLGEAGRQQAVASAQHLAHSAEWLGNATRGLVGDKVLGDAGKDHVTSSAQQVADSAQWLSEAARRIIHEKLVGEGQAAAAAAAPRCPTACRSTASSSSACPADAVGGGGAGALGCHPVAPRTASAGFGGFAGGLGAALGALASRPPQAAEDCDGGRGGTGVREVHKYLFSDEGETRGTVKVYVHAAELSGAARIARAKLEFAERTLTAWIEDPAGSTWVLSARLMHAVVPSSCRYAVSATGHKLSITLKKADPSASWPRLAELPGQSAAAPTPAPERSAAASPGDFI